MHIHKITHSNNESDTAYQLSRTVTIIEFACRDQEGVIALPLYMYMEQ